MSESKPTSSPANVSKGHQPISVTPSNPGQAGHQPSTGQGGSGPPATPPSQGSGEKR